MKKKWLAWVLALALVVGQIPQIGFSVGGHWATPAVEALKSYGALDVKALNAKGLDEGVTRGEFIHLVNTAFGLTAPSKQAFSDVKADAWVLKDLQIAYNQGYFKGLGSGVSGADNLVSREEAATLLVKLLKHDIQKNTAVSFKDAKTLSAWSTNYVVTATNKGILTGYSDGTFQPKKNLTLGEACSIISKAAGQVYLKKGTYGDANKSMDVAGNVTVGVADITLENMTIQGDLYLTEGIGQGHVTLKKVVVKGRTLVSGGGINSIIMIDTVMGKVAINVPSNAKVRLVAEGSTQVGSINAQSAVKLEESGATGAGFGEVTISVPVGASVDLIGDFTKVDVQTPGSKIDVLSGKIGEFQVTSAAKNTQVNLGAGSEITTAKLYEQASIGGSGTVQKAEINAPGVELAKKPATLVVQSGMTATVNKAPVSGGSSGGSSGGTPPTPPTPPLPPVIPGLPTLTVDSTDNDVEHDIVLTFTDNAAWRTAVTAVKVGGTALNTNDYALTAGSLKLMPSVGNTLLTTAGNKVVTVSATGFADVTANQTINHGALHHLSVENVGAIQVLGTSVVGAGGDPLIKLLDQYGNVCTSNNTATIKVVKATGTGDAEWSLTGSELYARTVASGQVSYHGIATAVPDSQTADLAGKKLRFFISNVYDGTAFNGSNWDNSVKYVDSPAFTITGCNVPRIASVMKTEGGANEVGVGPGDTFAVTFDRDTNRAGFAVNQVMTKTEVDNLLDMTAWGNLMLFGTDYTGKWTSDRTFELTCVTANAYLNYKNWTEDEAVHRDGKQFYSSGLQEYTFKASGNLKDAAGTSGPCIAQIRSVPGNGFWQGSGNFTQSANVTVAIEKSLDPAHGEHNLVVHVTNIDPTANVIFIYGKTGRFYDSSGDRQVNASAVIEKVGPTELKVILTDPKELDTAGGATNALERIRVVQVVNGEETSGTSVEKVQRGTDGTNYWWEPKP